MDEDKLQARAAIPHVAQPSEIPGVTEEYAHARRAYGLISALLMAWELIGVELESSPVENFKITIKSPQAAPYVLIVLILYFSVRTTIEWYQIDVRRRNLFVSRFDFAMAHVIAGAALGLFAVQTLLRIQIANNIVPGKIAAIATGSFIAAALFAFLSPSLRKGLSRSQRIRALSLAIIGVLAACAFVRKTSSIWDFLLGFASASGVMLLVIRVRKKSLVQKARDHTDE